MRPPSLWSCLPWQKLLRQKSSKAVKIPTPTFGPKNFEKCWKNEMAARALQFLILIFRFCPLFFWKNGQILLKSNSKIIGETEKRHILWSSVRSVS